MQVKRKFGCGKLIPIIALMFFLVASGARAQSPAVVIERDFYYSAFKAHLLLERYIPKGAMLFFGDSLIQSLEVESLHRYPANFGITGDTSAGLLHRLKHYRSLKVAEAVVLESGVNDLGFGSQFDEKIVENYSRMLALLPKKLDIYLIGIFPVNETIDPSFVGYNGRIKAINQILASTCRKKPRCTFINVNERLLDKDGNLSANYLRPKDGVHLNKVGRRIVLNGIRARLKKAQRDTSEGRRFSDQVPSPGAVPVEQTSQPK